MPASRFLKIVQETGQKISVQFLLASFYFPEPPCNCNDSKPQKIANPESESAWFSVGDHFVLVFSGMGRSNQIYEWLSGAGPAGVWLILLILACSKSNWPHSLRSESTPLIVMWNMKSWVNLLLAIKKIWNDNANSFSTRLLLKNHPKTRFVCLLCRNLCVCANVCVCVSMCVGWERERYCVCVCVCVCVCDWLMIALITCNSKLVTLLKGLCSSNPCRFEFSIFGVFAGIEPTTSGLTLSRSDQMS